MTSYPIAAAKARARGHSGEAVPTDDAPKLEYGMCGHCWGVDRVLDPQQPLCRFCDPRLADYLRRLVRGRDSQAQNAAVLLLAPVAVPCDPTGKEWAA